MSFPKKQWSRTSKSLNPSSLNRSSLRGPLSPLMTEVQKQTANIQDLSYDFSCRIIRLNQYLVEDSKYKELIISKQIYRSGTSVGANVRELMEQREQSLKLACLLCRVVTAEDASQSKHAQSDADFLSKMSIASKEADETDFWLNMLHDNGYLSDDQFKSINNDCQRVIRVLISIVKTCSQKIKK